MRLRNERAQVGPEFVAQPALQIKRIR